MTNDEWRTHLRTDAPTDIQCEERSANMDPQIEKERVALWAMERIFRCIRHRRRCCTRHRH